MKKVVLALIATTLCLLSASVLSAATLYVPVPYATIQAAITASTDPSDVIVVAAGTQFEDNILVNKPLTIQGGGIGVSFIDASGSTATGNVVTINITSGNVLFDGFTIKTGVKLNGIYAKSTSSASTITISHNRIEGYTLYHVHPPLASMDNIGLVAGYGSLASLVFTYNEIAGCDANSILLERHVGPTDVSYNTFDRNPLDVSSDAYFNMNYGGADITTLQKVSHNTIDMGAGTVFTNATRGAGISFASSFTPPGGIGGFTNIEITDNFIYNLKPYRRGIGLWNGSTGSGSDGDFDAPVIARNTILGNPGATGSYGIRLLGHVTNASITDNDCDRLDYGVWIRAWDSPIATGTVAHRNSFTRCSSYGMLSETVTPDINAEDNWWGDASGPAPTGTGSTVSSYVDFTPWVTAPNAVSVVPSYALTNCAEKRTFTFHIEPGAAMDVRGYEVKFAVNSNVAWVASMSDIKQKEFLNSVGTTSFHATGGGGGGGGGLQTYTVTCAILGGNVGAKVSGDLFTVDLTPFGEGTSAIDITSLKVRDINNVMLPSSSVDGSIQLDCTAPTMEAIAPAAGGWYNVAPIFSNFGFDDNLNLDRAEYKIDAGSWAEIFSFFDGVEKDLDGWPLEGFTGLTQGSHTVYFRVKDDAGNWNGEGTPDTYSWQFNKDTEVPAPPTNFVAMPGHNKTHLTWTNPTGDATFAGVEIRLVAWGGYPHYLPPAPSYPANPGPPSLHVVFSPSPAQAYDDNPRAPRDIYYYAAFSKDLAGNYSVLGDYAKDRTTSYWLGDVTLDGKVDISDLVPFSNAFGRSEPGTGWNELCDFGPTDDASRFGIPYPDNTIEFEDLMIFSMNWDKVKPVGVEALMFAEGTPENLEDLVKFDIAAGSQNVISVVLKNQATTLKGIHIVVDIEGGELARVNRGALLANRSDIFFGTLPGGKGTADVCVAALGVDAALIKASGEIARLEIKQLGEAPVVVRFKAIDLRNLDNNKNEIVVVDEHEAPFIPKATALMQNFPNPFNPTTTLSFDVAQAGNVTIQIYDVSGRLVATLLNAHKEIGRHRVEWNGKDTNGSLVPSGIYFYRMRAVGFEATKKMILVR